MVIFDLGLWSALDLVLIFLEKKATWFSEEKKKEKKEENLQKEDSRTF